MPDSTNSTSTSSTMPNDPFPPYTIHMWFPWQNGDCEYLLRYTRWYLGETNETGFVLEPIGENRSDFHQQLMGHSLDKAIRDLKRIMLRKHIPDELPVIAELLVKDGKGRIVAINDPELPPSPPDLDIIPY